MKSRILLAGVLVCLSSAAFGTTQLIANGGFESGGTGWTISGAGATVASNSAAQAHSGGAYLALGGLSSAYQEAYQTITIPTNAVSATLTYYFNVYPLAQQLSSPDSYLLAAIGNNSGTPLTSLDTEYNVNQDVSPGIYHPAAFDLTSYAGQTIQVQFWVVSASGSTVTYYSIDDVSVTVVLPSDLPVNDYFTNRTVLTGISDSVTADNSFATKEPGEPNHAGNAGGASLWWAWTAPAPGTAPALGTVTITTDNSSFDTLLAVYTGSSVSNLTKVAANDNEDSGRILTSRVSFNVTPGIQYQIAVDGANGATGTVYLALSFVLDTKPPTVSISAPASGAKLTNATVTIQGTASDNIGVAEVDYRLENAAGTNAYQAAVGTNRWSATITNLAPGLNTVRVRALDTSSNVSAQVTRSFTHLIVSPFTLTTNGNGSVSPNVGSLLVVSNVYTLTAKPATGSVFSNWTGGIVATTPALKFTMTSNLMLQANFIPNPFIPVQGSYAGLFLDTNTLAPTNSGFFTATLTTKGSLSAKLQLAGASYSLSGPLSLAGVYSNSLSRRGQSPLSVQLQVDLTGGDSLNGWISADAWAAELTANRAVYSRANPPLEGGNKYTLAVPAGDPALDQPGGFGFGALGVDASGNLSFAGTLGDGTKVSQKTFISKQHQWPFYLSLYSGKGAMFGWLTFTNEPGSDLGGAVYWNKLPQPGSKLYPSGFSFTNDLEVLGSLYQFTSGVPVLNFPNDGVVLLEGGNLAQNVTNGFALDASNKVTGTNKLNLKITTPSGLFQGSVLNPANGKPITVSGAVLQKQNAGFGTFAGTNQTGSVSLEQ